MRLHSSKNFLTQCVRRATPFKSVIATSTALLVFGIVFISVPTTHVQSSGGTLDRDARRVDQSFRFNSAAKESNFAARFSGKKTRPEVAPKLNHRLSTGSVFSPLLPLITATKTDALVVDNNNDNVANPGDTLRYTVVISNTGSTDATGVMFNDTVDNNTTLVPGSVTVTPVAIDDSYTANGNVRISVPAPGVLGNDSDAEGDSFTASGPATSVNGGNVAVNANGSFTYNPAPGFEGNDSFNYTITDSHGNTDSGTVSITVSGMIWFVDASAAGGGDGRLTSPFNCLVGTGCFQPVAADDPGDNIFLYSGNYTGGLNLLANEKLIGQGSSVALALVAGTTPEPNSDPLPATGGANPVITTVAAATNGINVASNNLIRGLTVGDTTATDINGTGFGALTTREVILNGLGRALNLITGTLDTDFGTIESIDSTTTGITLSGVSGTLISGSTNIQNPTGIGISITNVGAGSPGINFQNTTTVNGSGGTGVSISNTLASSTGAITFADLDIAPDNNQRALNITNSATVTTPGKITIASGTFTTTNTLATGQGSINIVGASAALRTPIDITLDSVTAVNTISATGNVITVNNTTDGGFKIIGSGTTAGSGGSITLAQQGAVFLNADNITLKNMNFTNANTLDGGLSCSSTVVTNCKAVINLNTVANASLDNVFIDRTVSTGGTEYGLFARIVSNLSVANSTIQNQGDGANEGTMRFSNVTGTSSITNSAFKFASFRALDATNDSGTLNLTINNSTFSDTQPAASGADGIFFRAQTTANVTMNVTNSFFTKIKTAGLSFISQNSAVATVNVTGSSFDPVAPGTGRAVDFTGQTTGVLNFNVNNNPKIYANGGTAVNVFAVDNSTVQGRVNNNPDIRLGGAGTAGTGVQMQVNQNATLAIEVIGNTISNIGNDKGIWGLSILKPSGTGGRLDATITGNNVSVNGTSTSGIDVQSGSAATDTNELCANVRSNTVTGAAALTSFKERTGSAGSTVFLEGFLVSATNTWNINLNSPLNDVTETNLGTLTGGTCNVPSHPTAWNYRSNPNSNLAKSIPAKVDASLAMMQALRRNVFASATAVPVPRPIDASKKLTRKSHHARANAMVATPTTAGSVSLNIGTLPAGESVTITFDVTINSPLVPPSTTQVSNQGTVSGSNFGSVLTDDPTVGGTADPTVTPVVNPNNPPDAVDDNATVAEDSGANTINVLTNDSTAPDTGETLTITAVTQGTNGSVAIVGGGTAVSYTPNANFFGSDSFTYTVNDGNGGTDTATVFVTVTEVNDAPTATDDVIANIAEDSGPYTIPFATLLANDSKGPANESGQTLTITAVANAVGGTVMISGTDVVFTPTANYNGPASFDYTVQDNGTTNGAADPKTDVGSVSFNITAVNDNPDAVDDNATVVEDSGPNTINVLTNDSIAPDTGETLTITAVTQGANGSVAITGGGTTVSYTPNANFSGSDSFTYTISDGNGGTDTATVFVTVTNVNDNPDAVNDSATVAEDSGANAINVLVNDTAAPDTGETLTITAVTQGSNGSVAITGGGTGLTYTPNANYFGPDSFTYTISDGNGGTDTATVSVTVTNVNDNPDAVDDSATVAEDSGANTINVLTNDSIAPDTGETLTITAVTQGANGSVAITGGGTTVSYTPNANFFGSDSFTYTISDGNGGSDTATVSVTVTPVNDAPVANAGPDQTSSCTGMVMLDGTGTTDVDNPNSSLTFVWKEGATVIATGETATVTLPVGTHTITLTVTDPGGLSSSDTVVITVVDDSAPIITMTGANIVLWPPDHNYHTVNVTDLVASASDACDPSVDINDEVISRATSDELEDGAGDGSTFDDIVIAANCKSVNLRAERSVNGNGRVYTITFLVRDSAGNTTTATAKVSVPKTQPGPAAVDDVVPLYTELSNCQ
jgi:hypothetical protein